MILTPCSPASSGLTIVEIDKMRTSGMTRKQDEFREFCAECPADVKRACLAQGFWTNEDNKRIVLEGIFGGLTDTERRSMI